MLSSAIGFLLRARRLLGAAAIEPRAHRDDALMGGVLEFIGVPARSVGGDSEGSRLDGEPEGRRLAPPPRSCRRAMLPLGAHGATVTDSTDASLSRRRPFAGRPAAAAPS